MQLRRWFLWSSVSILMACGGKEKDTDTPVASSDAGAVVAVPDAVDVPEAPKPLEGALAKVSTPTKPSTPEFSEIDPVLAGVGREGSVPKALEIRFAFPVLRRHKSDHSIDISPALEGKWLQRDDQVLQFRGKALMPSTTYRVTIKTLQTRFGEIKGPLELALTTPAFGLREIGLLEAPVTARNRVPTIRIAFDFTGTPAPQIAEGARLMVDGQDLTGLKLYTSLDRGKHRLIASPSHRAFLPGATVRVFLPAGHPSAQDQEMKAASGEAIFRIPDRGPQLNILKAGLVSSGDGYAIDVVCHDETFRERSGFWHQELQDYFRVSPRCELSEESISSHLQVRPKMNIEVSSARGGFRITGDFKRGPVSFRLLAGAKSADGATLRKTKSWHWQVPSKRPMVRMLSQGRYLSNRGQSKLPIQHVNAGIGQLDVHRVRLENLMFWLSQDGEEITSRTADLVSRHEVDMRAETDALRTQWLDLKPVLPEGESGLLGLTLSSRSGAAARSRLLLTDLNLIAKRSAVDQSLHAWVVDMVTNQPIVGAMVEQRVPSGRVLNKCTTGADGGCKLPALDKERLDKTAPIALVASKGSRLTYLAFKELRLSNSRHDISGLPYKDKQKYRAVIYSDRGVYRPGDTVRLAAVLRTPEHKAPPADMPAELQLRDARNRLVRKIDVRTNEVGQIEVNFPLGDFADTGTYNARLVVGDVLIASYVFKVEEFVPERMKVTAEMAKNSFGPQDAVTAEVQARYLFGGSAKGSPIDGEWSLSPSAFKPQENADYRFGPQLSDEDKQSGRLVGRVQSKVGDGPLKAPSDLGVKGPSDLSLKVAVLEAGSGRKTKGSAKALIHPADHYVGLKGDRKKLIAGEPSTIKGILVDFQGKILADRNGSVDVELLRIDERYGWVWDPVARRGRSRHYRKEISEQKQTVSVNKGRFEVTVQAGTDGGQFFVRARSGDARTDLSLSGKGRYRWWWSGREDHSKTPRPQDALALPMNLPEAVEVGKKAEAVLNLPMKGRMLMTLETDELVHSEWVDAEAGEFRWDFTVPAFVPNVYVSAFLIRSPEVEGGAFLPARAYGVASVRVKPLDYLETVTVSVPESVRSQSELKVNLSMGRRLAKRFVTVAVVDEGILQLTRFKTPDPMPRLFPRRRLQMQTFETVGWNVSIPASEEGAQDGGGSGGARPGGRVQPVKPVALWSGLVEVPEDGNLTLPFKLPPYRGELRVMVMAAGESTVGHAEARVTVADPLVVQATLPRFLSQGDRLRVPVFVSNLSGQKQRVNVQIQAMNLAEAGLEPFVGGSSKVLEVIGEAKKQVALEDKGSAVLEFQLRGLAAVGAGQVTVTAKAGAHVSEEKAQFPFLPAAPRSRRSVVVELEGGETDLKPYLEGWLPTTERSRFMISNTPYASSFDHLRYLVRYPYGCIEQTSSSTRPLLFVSSLLQAVDPESAAKHDLEAMVQSGIDRLFSMQTGHGGFAYWPGGSSPVVWGTAYATHVLLDAKKAGYPVDPQRLEHALDWLAQNSGTQNGRYYWQWGQAAYTHYVLALGGRGNKAAIKQALTGMELARFTRRPQGWDAETRYLLQAALYLAGDRSYEKQLRQPEIEAITNERANDWTFYSDLRRWGIILDTHAQLFGIHGSGEAIADHVARALSGYNSRRFSTQELAWAVAGLGRRLQPPAKRPKSMVLTASGSNVRPVGKKQGEKGLPSWSLYRASEYGELTLKVTGKTEGKLYLVISSEGIARDAVYEYGGNALVVTRNYRRRSDGKIMDLSKERLKLGEVVDVELTLSNSSSAAIQNIALVDRFPAGLEMETPRLGHSTGQPRKWLNRRLEMRPEHVNNRDDRVELFLALGGRRAVKAGYSLRATTSGEFRLPPTEAEAMYDPRLWARAEGGSIVVLAPGQENTD